MRTGNYLSPPEAGAASAEPNCSCLLVPYKGGYAGSAFSLIFQKIMKLRINTKDEETVEFSVFTIRSVELVYHDMIQITFHDDSVQELKFWPVETAQERAQQAYKKLSSVIEIDASSMMRR